MFKNLKLSITITLIIAIVSATCFGGVFLLSNASTTEKMEQAAKDNMITSLDTKSQIVDQYITDAESILAAFSKGSELATFLKDTANAQYKAAAQKYTTDYYSAVSNWEGLYLDTWASEVITHSNEGTVGLVMRKDDALKQLQDSMLAAKGVYNTGIIKSPASGQLVISMYYPIMNGSTPAGFVGGALQAGGMKTLLDATPISGLPNASYSLLNAKTGVYIFDEDEALWNLPIVDDSGARAATVKDSKMKEIIDAVNAGTQTGTISYKGDDGKAYTAVYKSFPERGWAFVIKDTEDEIYAGLKESQVSLFLICLAEFLLIVVLAWIAVFFSLKPLNKMIEVINKLKNLDLKKDESIQKYVGGKNEVGQLATAVDSLSDSFRDIISTLNECSISLTKGTDSMGNTSKDLMDFIENNAATTEELSASIINTNEAIDSMTSEIGKMNQLVDNIGSNVKDGSEKSGKLIETAGMMNDLATHTLSNNSSKIGDTKKKIEDAISDLQSLRKINEMATQILDITSQTNLLSLNASIEAARVGEAGRGFAVVAGEIGSLADSSSKTANEIQHICEVANKSIESVRECFEDIISFMEEDVSANFKKFADIAKDYGLAVEDIQRAIVAIDDSASKFISSVSNIQEQVGYVSEASSNNEAGVEDIISKNTSTTTTADEMVAIVADNKRNALSIKEIIDKFQNM